jgi:F-type H+-transporting ATPase subunit gamma
MASLRDIRRRIRSVKNTAQITRAMQMVAASRMRRAQQHVLAARPYAESMRSLISELALAPSSADVQHPLLVRRPVDTVGVIILTSDRGLCGALNTNVIRRATQLILEVGERRQEVNPALAQEVEVITIGRKGQDFMARRGQKLLATFTQLGDQPAYMDLIGIARAVMDSYMTGVMDECWLVYPTFVNTLVQRPVVEELLPIQPSERVAKPLDYIYEPDPAEILGDLLPRYVEVSIYQAVLETIASEHSARMIAMRNATENANDLVQSLTLSYNKARQAAITREVIEIAAAAEAMGGER